MNVMLTGGSGTLGKALIQASNSNFQNIQILAPNHQMLDIRDFKHSYHWFANQKLDAIIHAAAFIGLDQCENNKEKAYETNIIGTGIMCRIADQMAIPMIYISTDYVFDGKQGMYDEKCVPNPLSYYAKTKWAGECVVLSYGRQVIRTSFCREVWPHYGAFGDKWTSGDVVSIIASLILMCTARINKWNGILHVGTDRKTFFELAQKTSPNVSKTSLKSVGVEIPIDTSFDTSKLNEVLKK